MLVVIAGVSFTGLQLYYVVTKGGPQPTQDLEVSAQRFRLTSSFVGVTVLCLSLGFLYIFATAFYRPIPNYTSSDVTQGQSEQGAGDTAKPANQRE